MTDFTDTNNDICMTSNKTYLTDQLDTSCVYL